MEEVGRLSFTWSFGITTNDLDFIGVELGACLGFELDILDEKSPYIITKAVCLQMTFERKPRFDLVCQNI